MSIDNNNNNNNNSKKNKVYLLTGDIGGTNSRMSLYDANNNNNSNNNNNNNQPVLVHYYRNAEHLPTNCLSHPELFANRIVVPFLQKCWNHHQGDKSSSSSSSSSSSLPPLTECILIACIATAGIVTNNAARLTNLGNLLIDGNAMQDNTTNPYLQRIQRVLVINDFVAQGYGCLTLQSSEVRHLHGPKVPPEKLTSGPKVCVGAGTGLGECYLTQSSTSSTTSSNDDDDDADGGDYTCFPSEGGHVEYAPRNDEEVALFKYLSHKFTSRHRISVERVVSGKGLANVYDFLAHANPTLVDARVHEEFLQAGDEQGKVVAVHAEQGTLCARAMAIMMSAYGCEVGSAAIKWIPLGGLFVTGGLTPKNIDYIDGDDTDFMKSYLHKGRVSPILERIPLYAVMVEDLGVRGAHKAALMEYQRLYHGGGGGGEKSVTKKIQSSVLGEWPWMTLAVTAMVAFLAGNACSKSFLSK